MTYTKDFLAFNIHQTFSLPSHWRLLHPPDQFSDLVSQSLGLAPDDIRLRRPTAEGVTSKVGRGKVQSGGGKVRGREKRSRQRAREEG